MSARRIACRVACAAIPRSTNGGRVFAPSLATKVLGLRPSFLVRGLEATRVGANDCVGFRGARQGARGGCCRVAWWGIAAATAYPIPSLVTKEGMGGGG